MESQGKIDVWGESRRAEGDGGEVDHYLVAGLNRSVAVEQTSLGLEDPLRVHGATLGHVFAVARGTAGRHGSAPSSAAALDGIVEELLRGRAHEAAAGDEVDAPAALAGVLREARDLLGVAGNASGAGVTIVWVLWPRFHVARAGTAPCYRLGRGVLRELARDRSDAWDGAPAVESGDLELGDVLALLTQPLALALGEERLAAVLGSGRTAREVHEELVGACDPREDRTAVVVRFVDPADEDPDVLRTAAAPGASAGAAPAPPFDPSGAPGGPRPGREPESPPPAAPAGRGDVARAAHRRGGARP